MKNSQISKTILSLLCSFLYLSGTAQTIKMVKRDCYTTYKNQGDAYNNARNYDLAIQQYQNAKYCNSLSDIQRRTLDILIADVSRKRQLMKKVVRVF